MLDDKFYFRFQDLLNNKNPSKFDVINAAGNLQLDLIDLKD